MTHGFRQMYVNGRRAQRARTPTNGFYRIQGPSSQDKPFQLKFRGDDIRAEWAGNPNVEVVALLSWAELRMPVAAVDAGAHVARLTADPKPSNQEAAPHRRLHVKTRAAAGSDVIINITLKQPL